MKVAQDISFLRSFRHRNYVIFFRSQLLSLIGNWLQVVAQSWLIYRLTDSPLLLGLSAFSSQISVLFLGPWGGTLADNYPKKKLFLMTQTAATIFTMIMGIVVLLKIYNIPLLFLIIFLIGAANALEIPVRQSIMIEMVGKDELVNSIALNSLMFNIARVVGPILASMLILRYNEAVCFILNSLSFLPMIAALITIRLYNNPAKKSTTTKKTNFKVVLKYIRKSPPVYGGLFLIGVMGFMSMPLQTFLPVFADKVFHSDVVSYGWLTGAFGIGTLLAAISMVLRTGLGHAEHRIGFFGLLMAITTVAFSFNQNFEIALVLLAVIGFCMINMFITLNSYLQVIVPSHIRGRIMSVYVVVNQGTTPFGTAIIGYAANFLSLQWMLAIASLISVAAAIKYYTMAKRLRRVRIYMIKKKQIAEA